MHPSDIRIGQNRYSTLQLAEFIMSNKLSLEYKNSWDTKNKSISIESILLDLTMTPLYIDASQPFKWYMLDGHKRLKTLYSFINNEFSLDGLEFYPQYNGLTFEQLPFKQRRKIEETEFTVHTINQGVSDEVRLSLIYRIVPDAKNVINWNFRKSLLKEDSNQLFKQMIVDLKNSLPLRGMREEGYYELITNTLRPFLESHKEIKQDTSYEYILIHINQIDDKNELWSYWKNNLKNLLEIKNELGIEHFNKKTTSFWFYYSSELNTPKVDIDNDTIRNWNLNYDIKFKKLFNRQDYFKRFNEIKKELYSQK
ncbi:DUF262 domain-containing protein [Carboxylicivirga marina]|uniref:DUF262 domain-containing protein n=1 Tax=Carboxylicivirga marina TaxID=2800988 RepID=UPI002598D47D|nr:DUF262 domain-containing protein [uncultured Carboxylicivirga sp.]